LDAFSLIRLDGWPDFWSVNGHIDPDIQKVQANVKFAEPPHLFRNLGKGKFAEVTKSAGVGFATARVGRSVAYADVYDNGRLDILMSTNGGPVSLSRMRRWTGESQLAREIGWNEVESRWNWSRCSA